MSELLRRTFRITLDVTVSVNEIDEAFIKSREKYLHDPEQAQDPSTQESIARDRRLLAAALNSPHVLEQVLIHRAADSLYSVCPEDQSLEELQTNDGAQTQMIEALREALPVEDYEFHRDTCEVGLFYDNSTYFQDAFTKQQHHVTVRELLEE